MSFNIKERKRASKAEKAAQRQERLQSSLPHTSTSKLLPDLAKEGVKIVIRAAVTPIAIPTITPSVTPAVTPIVPPTVTPSVTPAVTLIVTPTVTPTTTLPEAIDGVGSQAPPLDTLRNDCVININDTTTTHGAAPPPCTTTVLFPPHIHRLLGVIAHLKSFILVTLDQELQGNNFTGDSHSRCERLYDAHSM